MPTSSERTTTTLGEALGVTAICFGLMIWQSTHAMLAGFPTSPFTNGSMLGLIAMELVLASVAIALLRARGFAIATLYPRPTIRGAATGCGLYLAAWVSAALALTPFKQAAQPIDSMVSEAALSLGVVIAVAVVNATFEEVFLLGFLVRGLRGFGLNVAIGASLLVRLAYHLYQGPLGAVSVLAFGIVLTLYFASTNKLWPPVFCHMLGDIIPFL